MARTFPRLRLDNGMPYPPDAALPVGTQFARVDPPTVTSIDPKFHTWRMVLWEVVRVDNTWKRKKGSNEHMPATNGFTVRDEQPLTADEIAWWSAWANDDGLAGLQEAA